MFYAVIKEGHKRKYFDGKNFIHAPQKKKKFQTIASMGKFFNNFTLPKNRMLYAEKIETVKKNPTYLTVNKKIQKAIDNFEDFSGHKAEFIDKKNLPILDVGFKIGTCDGILYTTVRDGRTEKYVHRFKGRARPILVSNFDGSFIALIGGHYKFTDRGIIDT